MTPTFTALDFTANLLYQMSCVAQRSTGVRWWCSSDEHREKWRARAEMEISSWQVVEEATRDHQDAVEAIVMQHDLTKAGGADLLRMSELIGTGDGS